MNEEIDARTLLAAYARGYFPMAQGRNEEALHWYNPDRRGILPLDGFHVPASLRKFMRNCGYEVTFDRAFPAVIRACADHRTPARAETWINDRIIALYEELAQAGFAHSVECWSEGRLAGGLYGVAMGRAFFGESMFSLAPNASKIALVHLAERLKETGFELLDTQYVNEHLKQFGAAEIARADYLLLLKKALGNGAPITWRS